ncbi:MAG TPA: CRTAC1 family protein [Bryobacteraceae bacterium]|nr:CRTAC1 family protein [Bryobacteraceae bacterium]
MPRGARWLPLGTLAAVVCALTTKDMWPVKFTDIGAKAGLIAANVSGDVTNKKYILEMNGSGVAFLDYNRDGYIDLFVVNGTQLERRAGAVEPVSHLYRNNGDGTFTDVTREAGVAFSGWGQGACAADFDNDGYDDLFVTYYGKNRLYHNNGNGTFTEMAQRAGVAGADGRWNSGCAFLDYDRDGKVDLFVANYVDLGPNFSNVPKPGSGEFCQYKGIPIACGPRGLPAAVNYLYHNNGDGTFTDMSVASGIRNTGGHYALGVLTFDYDNDGWPDIYVACDSAASILYHNQHNGTFQDAGVASGLAYNDDGEAQAGMGVAAFDYDHDGFLDVVKTNFSDDSPNLYHNNGDGTFSDRVFQAGLGRLRNFLGWGVVAADFDNDGWSDILMVNGHLTSEIDTAGSDSSYRQRKLLYRNLRDGRFEDVTLISGPDIAGLHSSRGAAAADLNNDGHLAVVVNELHEKPSLLVQEGPAPNHWIGIQLIGTKSNRAGIGARVEVESGALRQIDEVRSGGSYLSQGDLRLHFGLGAATRADRVTVRWPSGTVDTMRGIPADRHVVIEEGSGIRKRK